MANYERSDGKNAVKMEVTKEGWTGFHERTMNVEQGIRVNKEWMSIASPSSNNSSVGIKALFVQSLNPDVSDPDLWIPNRQMRRDTATEQMTCRPVLVSIDDIWSNQNESRYSFLPVKTGRYQSIPSTSGSNYSLRLNTSANSTQSNLSSTQNFGSIMNPPLATSTAGFSSLPSTIPASYPSYFSTRPFWSSANIVNGPSTTSKPRMSKESGRPGQTNANYLSTTDKQSHIRLHQQRGRLVRLHLNDGRPCVTGYCRTGRCFDSRERRVQRVWQMLNYWTKSPLM
ncbi:unnamed protein product [Protopolystoma xenopodis]|uniref:Uncharacterized protein n=1 Tax=Protopolystoma xenopodis TaxID=117903 RepID=A0A3S5AC29_9PLAT|nr:unnamed protein product [Protopolystoma xenopodis]